MTPRFLVSAAAAAFALTLPLPPAAAQTHEGHTMVTPGELKWNDVPSLPPGAKIAVIEGPLDQAKPFTFRLKLPANYKIPPHSHPAVERVTVLSGTFNLGMGEQFDPAKTTTLPAGSVAIMQPGTRHFVRIDEETIVQLNGNGPWSINYVNPADDPRKKN